MRKLICSIAAALMVGFSAMADEGMWMLPLLQKLNADAMKDLGCRLTPDQIYSVNHSSLKDAIVIFGGGCTGEMISDKGLLVTNHHCGYSSIQQLSSDEHNYLEDGFWAMNSNEEIPVPGLSVTFLVNMSDVTDAIEGAKSDEERRAVSEALVKASEEQNPGCDVELTSFYNNNVHYIIVYKIFRDIRFVGAPPASIGKFGGETDNWMWPRQTCDFSVFRIYADPKTNGPAEYSKDNVPYHPEHWAQVSLGGYKDGDFAMTMGYPGSTERYLSSYGIHEMRDAQNAPRAQVRGIKQDIMIRHMRADEAVRIKYDSKYAQSSNYWKNSIGMNKCIDSIGIISQKQEYEKRIRQYQEQTGLLKGKLDFDKMAELYRKRFDVMRTLTLWSETFARTSEFTTRALRLSNGMEVKGPKDNPKKQYVEFADNSDEWDEALDKEVMAALLKNFAEKVDPAELPDFYKTINKKFKGDYRKYVDFLYAKSVIMKKGEKIFFNKKSYKKDPGVQYGISLIESLAALREKLVPVSDEIEMQERYLCEAKLRMEQDLPHYSDANFTMRLSYGQVGGYELGGKPSGYYTTAESIVEKMDRADENIEYAAEPIMKELLSSKDFGMYTDKTTGKMQLCFLTNNDITGGNSGSPMFNGRGELIGLAFDGNWDSLSSDIHFDSRLARCIGVDIRYVLFMMDKWGHADRLLREINAI